MSNISLVDMIFLILITLLVIRGHVRGFLREFFVWASLLVSLWAAVLLHPAGATFIRSKIMQDVQYIPEILAFIAIFILVMLFVKMLEHILKDVMMGAKLGGANKLLGAIFGLAEGLTVTALVFFVLSIQPLFDASGIIESSTLAKILLPVIRIPIERGADIINTVQMFVAPSAAFIPMA
ncbi:MAG: CvpA family protein [Treponema sp.]|nr:CvpA family protein [Treponema sp.]